LLRLRQRHQRHPAGQWVRLVLLRPAGQYLLADLSDLLAPAVQRHPPRLRVQLRQLPRPHPLAQPAGSSPRRRCGAGCRRRRLLCSIGRPLVKGLESKAGEMSACEVGELAKVYRLVGLAAGSEGVDGGLDFTQERRVERATRGCGQTVGQNQFAVDN